MSATSRLAAAALALVIAAGCAGPRPPAAPAGALPAIVGAWRSDVQFTSGSFAAIKDLQFLYAFAAGGTMNESSNYDGSPPVPPAYGEWRETGPDRYEARYLFFASRPLQKLDELTKGGGWGPGGYGVLRERIELAADHQSFESTITLQMFDATGKAAEGGGSANAHGVRLGF